MELKRHKVIEGKNRCDRCEKTNPPITECSWPCGEGSHRMLWMDLCSSCQAAMDRLMQDKIAIDAYGQPEVSVDTPKRPDRDSPSFLQGQHGIPAKRVAPR